MIEIYQNNKIVIFYGSHSGFKFIFLAFFPQKQIPQDLPVQKYAEYIFL